MGIASKFIEDNKSMLNKIKKQLFSVHFSGGKAYVVKDDRFGFYGAPGVMTANSPDVFVFLEEGPKVIIGIDVSKCDIHFNGKVKPEYEGGKLEPISIEARPLKHTKGIIIPYYAIYPTDMEVSRFVYTPSNGRTRAYFFMGGRFEFHNMLLYGTDLGNFKTLIKCLYVGVND
jgi:hypothetical protein